jgi:hypothetical protein
MVLVIILPFLAFAAKFEGFGLLEEDLWGLGIS